MRPSAHSAPPLYSRRSSTPEALTWPTQGSFVTSVLCRSVDHVETYQASHRPNVHRRSKFNLGRRREMAQEPLRRPNSERSAQVLRSLGADESYGISMLGDTDKTIGVNLLPSLLSLCGGHFGPRASPDSWKKQGILGVNRFDVPGFESTPVHNSGNLWPTSPLPQTCCQDRGSRTRCYRCTDLDCPCEPSTG